MEVGKILESILQQKQLLAIVYRHYAKIFNILNCMVLHEVTTIIISI